MGEVNFYLKSPAKTTGKSLLYLKYKYNGQVLVFTFGQNINPSIWNENKQRVKNNKETTADGRYSLNDLLDNLVTECKKAYNLEIKKGVPKPEILRKYLQKFMDQNKVLTDQGPTLFKLFERFISNEIKYKGKNKSTNTLKTYNTTKGHLLEFQQIFKHRVDFDTVTLEFFYKYVDFLGKRGSYEKQIRELRPELKNKNVAKIGPNAISKDIQILKTVMAEAVDLNYTKNMEFKHKKFFVSRVETDAVYLNEDELNRLYSFDLSENKRLEQVRDLFIFGSWVGLRFGDYNNVKPENIVERDGDKFIQIITQKTGEQVIIPCNPVVQEIFYKYRENRNRLPKSVSNQKFNDYIKEVCKIAGMKDKGRLMTNLSLELWQCISSHTARRSFATNLYLDGYPTIEIMKITGHRTEKAFMRYIKVSKIDAAKRLSMHIKKKWSEKILRVA